MSLVSRPLVPHRPARTGQAPGFVDLPDAEEPPRVDRLSVVLAVRQAGDRLAPLLGDAAEALEAGVRTWELFVVDHGPGDHGPAVVDGWSARVPSIRGAWIGSDAELGEAVEVGLERALHEPVLVTDGRARIPLTEALRILPELDRVDLVLGRVARAPHRPGRALWRRLCLGRRATESDPLFVLLGARALERLRGVTRGPAYGVALPLAAAKAGLSWCEVPVEGAPTPPARDALRSTRDWWRLRRSRT